MFSPQLEQVTRPEIRLPPLIVEFLTIITESVVVGADPTFVHRYVAAWSARAVVMMNALSGWLAFLINGVEVLNSWH
jgi:hypothetical protein